ncbi:MFS transporter [Flexivirga meconopsidis]|uniref:MFS transporter n=1 Tax=Flexivirga meconopsidis TaxID=2977121 RepID=UPI002240DA1C|nr:MFS transporter [Flexivirga meconopsidis]
MPPSLTTARHRGAWPFAAATFALAALLIGTNLPTPLYPTYERVFSFAPLGVTLIFATYAIVLIPSLLIFGPLSDVVGRRRVLLPAVLVAALASALFAVADGVAWLFAARAVQGIALGAVQGTATAALVDTEPGGRHKRAALVGSIATAAGGAAGPLLGGLLAEYAPAPRVLPYLVEIGLLLVAFVGLARFLPPTASTGKRWRPERPSVPAAIRGTFAVASVVAFLAWAVTALFMALMPSYLAQLTQTQNLLLAGGIVALMLGCSAAAQTALPKLGSTRAQTGGLILLIAGLGGIIAAAQTSSVTVVFVATVLAGVGQGMAFAGSLADTNAVAPHHRRADVLSSFYVVMYAGVALPVIGIGFLAIPLGLIHAVEIFSIGTGVACVLALVLLRVTRQRRHPLVDG